MKEQMRELANRARALREDIIEFHHRHSGLGDSVHKPMVEASNHAVKMVTSINEAIKANLAILGEE